MIQETLNQAESIAVLSYAADGWLLGGAALQGCCVTVTVTAW